LDGSGVLWHFQGSISEKRPDRGHSHITASHTIAAMEFQIVQECPDKGGTQIFKSDFGRPLPKFFLGELQEQSECVPVRCDRMGAGPALCHQALCEEQL
jgi:hypothetical protein